jgi:hypothetical protein
MSERILKGGMAFKAKQAMPCAKGKAPARIGNIQRENAEASEKRKYTHLRTYFSGEKNSEISPRRHGI